MGFLDQVTRSALALGVAALVLRGSYLFSTENAVRGSDPLAAFSVENRYDPLQESARVSTARVGAHQQASNASPILGYADYGVELTVQAVEGDWCRVGLPMGGARKVSMALTTNCPVCGGSVTPGVNPCPHCGATLDWAA